MLQVLNNNECIRIIVQEPEKDLDIINFLFPNSVIEIGTIGNELIAIVKEDHAA